MLDKINMTQRKMDEKCHELFLNKEILAPILQETVEEYKGLSVQDIINLIDEDSISKAEAVSDFPISKDVRISQTDTDLKSVSDKLVMFDIHFKAALPKDKRSKLNIRLYIDFEAQGKYYPKYPIIKRAMYYAARGLARQLGELTEETNYGKLQKVYSIWVCYDPKIPKKLKNTLSRYVIKKEDLFGKVEEDVDEEVKSVQGVGLLIYNKGIAEGMTQGRIKALYNDAGFTVEEISEKTNLSEDEIKEILMSDEENC